MLKLKPRGKSVKKGEHLSVETEFKKGHRLQTGDNHWHRNKERKYKQHGYYEVFRPNHPRTNTKNHIKQHVLVMEEKIGRLLTKKEIVHHINGIRSDDRPENLYLFADNRSHLIYENNLTATYKKWIQQDYNLSSEG